MDVLDRFLGALGEGEREILTHVQEFMEWYVGHGNDFVPSSNDDVALRTYLLHLKMNGVSVKDQHRQIASLRRFYDWAESLGYLSDSHPFTEFSIERPTLTREQIRRRKEIFSGSAEEREIARLRALNRLAEQLNRSSDVQSTLTSALEILLSLMDLQTAWAFLLPSATNSSIFISVSPSDRFSLAACFGLPPGLEKNDRYYLKNPKICHCQAVMLTGQLRRAVNIVECTRLLESSQDNEDNQGLMFHASVPILASGQPLGILNVATEEWQLLTGADLQLLSAVGTQVAIGLERARLFDVTQAQRLHLERELKLARELQDSLLPETLPEIPGYSLAADWRSALEMAGDFYDIFPLPDGRWGIVVADVSDKGAAAAMYMAMTRSLIRTSAGNYSSPAGALREVNQHLIASTSTVMFVTVFYAVLDVENQTLTYANAGHNPPLLRRTPSAIESLTRTGAALGVIEDLHLSDSSIVLTPGDSLVIYTDGIPDALNSRGEEYGIGRLFEAVGNVQDSNARLQLDTLSNELDNFIGNTPPFDDITFFILARESR